MISVAYKGADAHSGMAGISRCVLGGQHCGDLSAQKNKSVLFNITFFS